MMNGLSSKNDIISRKKLNVHERNLKQLCNIYTFKTALPLIKLGLKIVLNNKQIGSYENLYALYVNVGHLGGPYCVVLSSAVHVKVKDKLITLKLVLLVTLHNSYTAIYIRME